MYGGAELAGAVILLDQPGDVLLGGDPALAGSVSSERMYWLTPDQARQLNLVNEVLRIGE